MLKKTFADIIVNNSLNYQPESDREVCAYIITAAGTFRCSAGEVDVSSDDHAVLKTCYYFPQISNAGGSPTSIYKKRPSFPIIALNYVDIVAAALKELPLDKYKEGIY